MLAILKYYFILHMHNLHPSKELKKNYLKRWDALVACWCRQVMAQAVTLRATALFVGFLFY